MGFDLVNFLTTLFATGIGAWGAYHFNVKQENERQKEVEKAQLMTLFYDINILSKFMYFFCTNVIRLIENICKGDTPYDTPLRIEPETIDINKLGFITQKSNKMYEILVHTRMQIMTIYEQGIIYNESIMNEKKDSLKHLILISHLYPRAMAMLYICMLNINFMLMKEYKVKNLIRDNILNTLAEILEIIDGAKKQYASISNNKELICLYTGEAFSEEQIEDLQENMEYVESILKDWLLDFGLSKKQKQEVKNDIEKKLTENLDAKKNDL